MSNKNVLRRFGTYNLSGMKNLDDFLDCIHYDHKHYGIDRVHSKLDEYEWLYLMGLYDTMFIR